MIVATAVFADKEVNPTLVWDPKVIVAVSVSVPPTGRDTTPHVIVVVPVHETPLAEDETETVNGGAVTVTG